MQLHPPRTIAQTVDKLVRPEMRALAKPAYMPRCGGDVFCTGESHVALAVESMRRHMTSEGWEIMLALEHAGYVLHGHNIGPSLTDVPTILNHENPSVIVMQDKREIDGITADRSMNPAMRFNNLEALKHRPDVFKLTILKDAQHNPAYHRASMEEIGCHAVIAYYHPVTVAHLAPYVRRENIVRTYHTLDRNLVPPFSAERRGCLISGAVSKVYPLRRRLIDNVKKLPQTNVLRHPGYRRLSCATPEYLQTLSRYKVSICTSSVYGYLLRKVIESTACGCIVVTDLPTDERLPEIDGNLVRVHPNISVDDMTELLALKLNTYDPALQESYSRLAMAYYDYRVMGVKLANDIEAMRKGYNT